MNGANDKRENKDTNAGERRKTTTYNYSGDNRIYQDGRGRTAHRTIVRFVKLLNVIMVSIPFIAAWTLYYSNKVYHLSFYR